jgi:hypothetical protein
MWKWFKYKKETKLTQIVPEETIREALADENLKDSSKKKVIKVKISQERNFSFPPILQKM